MRYANAHMREPCLQYMDSGRPATAVAVEELIAESTAGRRVKDSSARASTHSLAAQTDSRRRTDR
jgi:hypothetical protein